MIERRSTAFALGVATFGVSVVAAAVIYFTHPVDPHDEGVLVAIAAFLWPFLLSPLAWLACAVLAVADYRRGLQRKALIGLMIATTAWPTVFVGYFLNRKPWLSPAQMLTDPWPDVRARGAAALGERGTPEGLPLLVSGLADPQSEVRAAAATALGRYGPRAESAIPALVRAMEDDDSFVGCQAAEALGAMRGLGDRVLPPLLAQLTAGSGSAPWCAARAIAGLGPEGAPAVPALVTSLSHPDANIRSAAAETLGHIGPGAESAVPDLTKAAHDENQWVRKAAQEALPKVRSVQ